MKTEEQIKETIETLKEVIIFTAVIDFDRAVIMRLKGLIKMLEWVVANDI